MREAPADARPLRAAKYGTGLADAEKDWLVDRINDFLGRGGARALETPPTTQERIGAIADLPASCKHCGAPLSGELVKGAVTCTHCGGVFRAAVTKPPGSIPVAPLPQLVPADLPPDSPIRIDEDDSERLQLHYLMAANPPTRWLVPLFTVPFSMAWYAGVFSFIAGIRARSRRGPLTASELKHAPIPGRILMCARRSRTKVREREKSAWLVPQEGGCT